MQHWRAFERLVARLTSDEYEHDLSFTVIPNARIKGYISNRKRQIDVLVECRSGTDLDRRIIFDAKDKKRPIDIKEVEAFEGLMRDVQAKRGFLVCTNGHTKAALTRAQEHIGIRLISPDELDDFDPTAWDSCLSNTCSKGLVLWDTNFIVKDGPWVTLQNVGKCDVCGKFHIWCSDCGDRICLQKEDDWQCYCTSTWFWLSSIEDDVDKSGLSSKGAYLLLIDRYGKPSVIDRRPL